MRLSEALIQRADTQKRINQLKNRLERSARIQEGEQPPEDPLELLQELSQLIDTLTTLVAQINMTNSQIAFDDTRTLTEALAERDSILLHRKILENTISVATGEDHRRTMRFARSQIKSFSTMDVRELQATIDQLSRRYRELDTRIQELNWSTDLIE